MQVWKKKKKELGLGILLFFFNFLYGSFWAHLWATIVASLQWIYRRSLFFRVNDHTEWLAAKWLAWPKNWGQMDTNFEAFQPKIFQLVSKACKKKKKTQKLAAEMKSWWIY